MFPRPPRLDRLRQDVKYAWRNLVRHRAFSVAVIATLALAIGANAAVVTVANAVLFKGLPFVEQNDRLLYLERPGAGHSYADFEAWRATATSFEELAAATAWLANLLDGDAPARVEITVMSASGFRLIGQRPMLGRDFVASDEASGATPVVILSHRLWQQRYGADPSVLGKTVRLEFSGQNTATVVGVMADGVTFPFDSDLWLPLAAPATPGARDTRAITFFFGKLHSDVDARRARAELAAIDHRLANADPFLAQHPIAVQDSVEHFVGARATQLVAALVGAVAFVLLIAWANLANLTLARTISGTRETAVRMALGAGRGSVVRLFAIEGLMLATAGGLLGWLIAIAMVDGAALARLAPFNYRHGIDVAPDHRITGYLVALIAGTALLLALAPLRRLSALDITAALKDGGAGAGGSARAGRLSTLLVAGETALAVVLLTGSGVMVRSFVNIYTADIGVAVDGLAIADLGLPATRYASPDARASFYTRLQARLESLPGVHTAAIADRFPTQGTRRLPYELERVASKDADGRPLVSTVIVGTGYVQTLGATLLAGREFTAADDRTALPVLLVNERFAAQQWPGENPVGKRLRLFEDDTTPAWRTVVGVVSNIVQRDATRQTLEPLAYLPYGQASADYVYVFARTSLPPASLVAALAREVQAIDRDLPITFSTLATRLESNYRHAALAGLLLVAFAAIALLLASLGLYAVVAHAVSRRIREVGIRMSLGATPRAVRALVFAQSGRPVAAGLAIGAIASLAVNRTLTASLVNVSPADPISFVVAALVLVLAAALGCAIPVRRAMRVDPVIALKQD